MWHILTPSLCLPHLAFKLFSIYTFASLAFELQRFTLKKNRNCLRQLHSGPSFQCLKVFTGHGATPTTMPAGRLKTCWPLWTGWICPLFWSHLQKTPGKKKKTFLTIYLQEPTPAHKLVNQQDKKIQLNSNPWPSKTAFQYFSINPGSNKWKNPHTSNHWFRLANWTWTLPRRSVGWSPQRGARAHG